MTLYVCNRQCHGHSRLAAHQLVGPSGARKGTHLWFFTMVVQQKRDVRDQVDSQLLVPPHRQSVLAVVDTNVHSAAIVAYSMPQVQAAAVPAFVNLHCPLKGPFISYPVMYIDMCCLCMMWGHRLLGCLHPHNGCWKLAGEPLSVVHDMGHGLRQCHYVM